MADIRLFDGPGQHGLLLGRGHLGSQRAAALAACDCTDARGHVMPRALFIPFAKPNGSGTIAPRGGLFPAAANTLSLDHGETVEASLLLAKLPPERL